jgi:hypothetical protein
VGNHQGKGTEVAMKVARHGDNSVKIKVRKASNDGYE